MTTYKYKIPEHLNSQRLDKALSLLCQESTRSQIQKAIKNNQAVLNNKIISNLSSRVKENDVVEINIIEEMPENIEPTNIPPNPLPKQTPSEIYPLKMQKTMGRV